MKKEMAKNYIEKESQISPEACLCSRKSDNCAKSCFPVLVVASVSNILFSIFPISCIHRQ